MRMGAASSTMALPDAAREDRRAGARHRGWSVIGRHLHFMGIGGVGMCGLAEVLQAGGATVSGCDLAASERTERLSALGIDVRIGHDPNHLDGVDTVVYSAAVGELETELESARRGPVIAWSDGRSCSASSCAVAAASPSPGPTARPRPPR